MFADCDLRETSPRPRRSCATSASTTATSAASSWTRVRLQRVELRWLPARRHPVGRETCAAPRRPGRTSSATPACSPPPPGSARPRARLRPRCGRRRGRLVVARGVGNGVAAHVSRSGNLQPQAELSTSSMHRLVARDRADPGVDPGAGALSTGSTYSRAHAKPPVAHAPDDHARHIQRRCRRRACRASSTRSISTSPADASPPARPREVRHALEDRGPVGSASCSRPRNARLGCVGWRGCRSPRRSSPRRRRGRGRSSPLAAAPPRCAP